MLRLYAELTIRKLKRGSQVFGCAGGSLLNFSLFSILISWMLGADPVGAADPLEVWQLRASASPGVSLWGITYGNNTFVAVGEDGVQTSRDGASWTKQGPIATFFAVTYGNGIFVAVGPNGTVATSEDALTWAPQTSGTSMHLRGIAHGNETFVAVGMNELRALVSSNAVAWSYSRLISPGKYFSGGIAFGNGYFAGTARDTYSYCEPPCDPIPPRIKIFSSINGVNWNIAAIPTTNRLFGIAYGNSTFVAVGNGGTLITGTIPGAWTNRSTGTINHLAAVAYGTDAFVVVGSYGTILTSPDGIEWTHRNSPTLNSLTGITYGNGTFVAVGADATIVQNNSLTIVNISVQPSPINPEVKAFMFEIPTLPYIEYIVEFKDSLTATAWTPLRSFFGDGLLKTFFEEIKSFGARFFRAKKETAGGFLSFPLAEYTPYTAPISAIFDHSGLANCSNGVVVAFTGETGLASFPKSSRFESGLSVACPDDKLYGFAKDDVRTLFSICNQYVGADNDDDPAVFLFYDGHTGYDYDVADGTEVYSATDGKVIKVVYNDTNFRLNEVVVTNSNTYTTHYLHFSQTDVVVDQEVIGGVTKLGEVGSGHLHFTVKKGIQRVDPYGWRGPIGQDPLQIEGHDNKCLWLECTDCP